MTHPEFPCTTVEKYAEWQAAARLCHTDHGKHGMHFCLDCTSEFQAQAAREGRCTHATLKEAQTSLYRQRQAEAAARRVIRLEPERLEKAKAMVAEGYKRGIVAQRLGISLKVLQRELADG